MKLESGGGTRVRCLNFRNTHFRIYKDALLEFVLLETNGKVAVSKIIVGVEHGSNSI